MSRSVLACLASAIAWTIVAALPIVAQSPPADYLRAMQLAAVETGSADWGHWGPRSDKYSSWTSHSNRMVGVWTYGITLERFRGPASVYRDEQRLTELYGYLPPETWNPQADYFDQTDVARLQEQAVEQGKRYIFLIVFDGMDWHTARAAAIYAARRVGYASGRGTGLAFQDYRGAPTDFGLAVTSPFSSGADVDVNAQVVISGGDSRRGGFAPAYGGAAPWQEVSLEYLIGHQAPIAHAVTDSSSSATSLCAGIKTFNGSVNVDPEGKQVEPIAVRLQRADWAVGVVTSVPVSHATPAAAYSNNVSRNDYQDLGRDLIGLPSVAHRANPRPGVDVLLGCGWNEIRDEDPKQGSNYLPGNRFIAKADVDAVDIENGGAYVIVERTPGRNGAELLNDGARRAIERSSRLLGMFGATDDSHLPFRTADGGYDPTRSPKSIEVYSEADLAENPTLARLTEAGLDVLAATDKPFWMMIESGDVDWANHGNNIDNAIGAVLSGDEAFTRVVGWIERHDVWPESCIIITADHGHLFVLDRPDALAPPSSASITEK
jgi:alkaline phosphatase